ncbi:MAG: 2-succinyl-5-enolpyruvyl-6-hydroxy-3-cyclohexene-1-carboxylic-acid synthase, partial [Sciscionella sp.]
LEPIVLLTADRPVELIGSGANQTTVQHGIFGPHAATVDFPIARRRGGQNALWRGLLCRVLADREAAPLHINIPFAEPLVPESDAGWPEPLQGRDDGAPWTVITSAVRAPTQGIELLRALPARTLVLVGEAPWHPAAAAGEVARAMDWPLLVEPPGVGPRHALSSASLIVNSVEELPEQLRPDAIVVVGRPTLSRGVNRLLRSGIPVHLVCTPAHWADAQYVASSAVVSMDPAALEQLSMAEREQRSDPGFSAGWRKANERIAAVIAEWLAAAPWPTGAGVAAEMLRALPAPAVLFFGSSNAIRDADLVAERRGDLTVLANRGLAGIDGAISTALGATMAVSAVRGRPIPGFALLGDLSFLHDAGALLRGPDEPGGDLTVVVNNDNGGGIFALLEQGEAQYGADFERIFGTPQDVDIAALCAGYRVRHTLVGSPESLRRAIESRGGIHVVEVRTDRAALRAQRAELHAAVIRALR